MQMSQHQMLRRWPQATAWYTDVINYMLRSTRNDEVDQRLADSAPRWATASLGEFLREVAIHSTSANANDKERRVAEALRILWPDFPPVQNAFANTDRELKERWRPVCLATLETYDLELRPGVSPDTLVWAMDAMNSRQTLEAISGNGPTSERVAGTYWPSSAWATAILFSGACTDRAGNSLSPNEISERQPARTYTLATV